MSPMNYYSLGYCKAHSKYQWLLEVKEEYEVEEEMRMLGDGASTSNGGHGGMIVGLGILFNMSAFECLNMAFTEWKGIYSSASSAISVPTNNM